MRIELALTGQLDLAQIDPVAEPLAERRQVERRRQGDALIEVAPRGRLQERRLNLELCELDCRSIALEFRNQSRRFRQSQHLFALPRGQVRDLPGDVPVFRMSIGVQPNVRSESSRSVLDAQIVAQVQGRPQLPGHRRQIDGGLQPRAALDAGGIEPSPFTEPTGLVSSSVSIDQAPLCSSTLRRACAVSR